MPATFAEFFADLSQKSPALFPTAPALFPTAPADAALSKTILSADLFDGKSGAKVEICRAGLLLWNDDLDAAHPLTQADETQTGSFWHAIIHRREADFSNARYWWRRVGTHPTYDEIGDLVLHRVADFPLLDEIRGAGGWQPIAFTEYCEKAKRDGAFLAQLQDVQRLEMRVLLEWCASQVK